MAGVYIHVPFCKTRCIYCDFFTRTDQKQKNPYVASICQEIGLRSDYIANETIDTIYFGGGTPSQLPLQDLQSILKALKSEFIINENAEITLEANPDDLFGSYLDGLLESGFNRLSMGVQSFNNDLLHFLNRRHSAEKAIEAVKTAKQSGFNNISIDLMYGLPQQTISIWKESLDLAISLDIQHISSYHLIYEEGTKLYRLQKKGEITPIEEDISLNMFSVMIDKLNQAGFIHYEISNFAQEGYYSRHNSSYWLDTNYLGLGPAAHSYNRKDRSWNIASIPLYLEGIRNKIPNFEKEILDERANYNDFVLTGMRTIWGIKKTDLEKRFGSDLVLYFEKNIKKHIDLGLVTFQKEIYKLTRKGIFVSDTVMSDLMYIE